MKKTMLALMLCSGALAADLAMGADPAALARQKQCYVCHDATQTWMIGPPFRDMARRYKAASDAKSRLVAAIQSGTEGHWAASKMPTQSRREPLSKDEAELLAEYVMSFE